MKVAVTHDWLVNYGGGERVLQQLLVLYPDADIYTLVYDAKKMASFFPPEKVHVSCLQRIPMATRLYPKMLSLMPGAWEAFDLTGYDLVLSSSSSCAKGVITRPDTPHIAYIHSPMRYAWDLYYEYYRRSGMLTRFFMQRWIPGLRQWDYISSQRVDCLVSNSSYIARRIQKFWGREATVVNPPVNTVSFTPNGQPHEGFYLAFSRLVPYKRLDLAVQACGRTGRKLVVIGSGGQEKELRQLAASFKGADICFTGRIADAEVKSYLQRCRALIFCAQEDFGIIPVEAQACGRPVIAYGSGGALETVIDGTTGVFFAEQTAESLLEALDRFERLDGEGAFKAGTITAHAAAFSEDRFRSQMAAVIEKTVQTVKSVQKGPAVPAGHPLRSGYTADGVR
ncbi:MAG: glycosyltransferase [Treponema sp.]|nr:glycosyltransferase [Treponema sp.]